MHSIVSFLSDIQSYSQFTLYFWLYILPFSLTFFVVVLAIREYSQMHHASLYDFMT